MIRIFIFVGLTLCTPGYSQSIPMNGVLGLICQDSVQSLDYWEAKHIHGYTYNKVQQNEFYSPTKYTSSFENRFKQLSSLYETSIGLMLDMAKWLPPFISLNNSSIEYTEDLKINDREISTVEFFPPNCKIDYLAYSIPLPDLKPEESISFKFFINKTYWDKLNYINRVFILSHFIFGSIYDDDFIENEHSLFQRMRHTNSLFLSDQLYKISKDEFSDIINN